MGQKNTPKRDPKQHGGKAARPVPPTGDIPAGCQDCWLLGHLGLGFCSLYFSLFFSRGTRGCSSWLAAPTWVSWAGFTSLEVSPWWHKTEPPAAHVDATAPHHLLLPLDRPSLSHAEHPTCMQHLRENKKGIAPLLECSQHGCQWLDGA